MKNIQRMLWAVGLGTLVALPGAVMAKDHWGHRHGDGHGHVRKVVVVYDQTPAGLCKPNGQGWWGRYAAYDVGNVRPGVCYPLTRVGI